MIIQTIFLDPTGAVWTDEASNVSRLDPSGAVQVDAAHPSSNREVVGSNPSSGSKTAGQSIYVLLSPPALLASLIIPGAGSRPLLATWRAQVLEEPVAGRAAGGVGILPGGAQ